MQNISMNSRKTKDMRIAVVNEKVYSNISIDELLVYAVKRVLSNNKICNFEDLVVTCHALFPKVFSLYKYPQFPDSSRVNKSWLRCRTDKGWLSGSVKSGFTLTELGKKVAEEVEKKLELPLGIKEKKRGRERTRDEAIINFVKKHSLFKKFQTNRKLFDLSESEFRSLLMCTLETPQPVVKSALHQLEEILKKNDEKEILEFIDFCARKRGYR